MSAFLIGTLDPFYLDSDIGILTDDYSIPPMGIKFITKKEKERFNLFKKKKKMNLMV